jgi:hypothetical protein
MMFETANKDNQSQPTHQRMQSAMVLFSLEEALGAFVLAQTEAMDNMPPGMLTALETRANKKPDSVLSVVRETYIGRLLTLQSLPQRGVPKRSIFAG